ncbi:hypothetical protein V5E97_13100 [Singulisphaera sp. Ch08]|uniref:Uncharacterized protein n=1 Tax=Singulisphaera sp. Ch08 TaxID=3120278 RepID=A0AAU7CPJ7_9BACT
MGFLLIFAAIAPLACINVVIVRLFQRWQAKTRWWTVLTAAWVAGAALGVVGGFFFEYRASPQLRVVGAPIPAVFLHWEGAPGEEEWVDFVTPAPLLFAGSNIAILGLMAACPVGLVFWLRRRARVDSGAT